MSCRHREPHRRGTHAPQRDRPGLQHVAACSRQHHGRDLRFKGDYPLAAPDSARQCRRSIHQAQDVLKAKGRHFNPALPTLPRFPFSSKLVPVDDVVLATQGYGASNGYAGPICRVSSPRAAHGGPDAAEELTQDVRPRVAETRVVPWRVVFATWLHRLAVNVIIERFRRWRGARGSCG